VFDRPCYRVPKGPSRTETISTVQPLLFRKGDGFLNIDASDSIKAIWDMIDSYVVRGSTICDFDGIVIPRSNVQLDSFLDIFYPHLAGFNYSLDEERIYYRLLKEWAPSIRYLGDRYLDEPNSKIDWDQVHQKTLLPIHGSFYFHEKVNIDQGDTVFDIGSAPGDFTAAALCKGAGKVYVFEPSATGVQKLNHLLSVTRSFEIVDRFLGASVDDEQLYTTVDHFCSSKGIDRLNFIKMDVEGMENDVLLVAKWVLRDLQPKMVICTYHKPGDRKKLTETVLRLNPRYSIIYGRSVMYCYVERHKFLQRLARFR